MQFLKAFPKGEGVYYISGANNFNTAVMRERFGMAAGWDFSKVSKKSALISLRAGTFHR